MMTQTETNNSSTPKHIPFGARLQSAREALGLESKDAAAQLRLNERVILMMEQDCYSSDIPPTFMRGYIRAYGKLLQIPEQEIKLAVEPIKPPTEPIPAPTMQTSTPVTSGNYFMQIFTYLIIFTLVSLVGTWWYSHSRTPAFTSGTQVNIPMETISPTVTPPTTVLPMLNDPDNVIAKAPQTIGTTTATITAANASTTTSTALPAPTNTMAPPIAPKPAPIVSKTTNHTATKPSDDSDDEETDEEDTPNNSSQTVYRR